jgi:hypothetical protein
MAENYLDPTELRRQVESFSMRAFPCRRGMHAKVCSRAASSSSGRPRCCLGRLRPLPCTFDPLTWSRGDAPEVQPLNRGPLRPAMWARSRH